MEIHSVRANGLLGLLEDTCVEVIVDGPIEIFAADPRTARFHGEAERVVILVAGEQGQVESAAAQVIDQDITSYLDAGLGVGDGGGHWLFQQLDVLETCPRAASRSLSFSASSKTAGQVITARATGAWKWPFSASRLIFSRIKVAASRGSTCRSPNNHALLAQVALRRAHHSLPPRGAQQPLFGKSADHRFTGAEINDRGGFVLALCVEQRLRLAGPGIEPGGAASCTFRSRYL